MVLRPILVTSAAPEVTPRTPRPTGPLMNELVERTVERVRQQPGEPVVKPHGLKVTALAASGTPRREDPRAHGRSRGYPGLRPGSG
jgi:hypothetical protein